MNTNLPPPNYHQLQENEAGEFSIINRLIKLLAQPPFSHSQQGINKEGFGEKSKGLLGIGDDCAVIPSSIVGKYLLTSVDSFIEGRHFLFEISTPQQIGFKSLATAVSDIAAMGGEPRFVLINLHLPKNFDYSVVEKMYEGVREFCGQYNVFVIGGNISSSAEVSLSVTVIGQSNEEPLVRSGAQVGDDVWVSGTLGLSQMGLSLLKDQRKYNVSQEVQNVAISCYQRPDPRIILGNKIAALGATSAIDLSDGIFQDAGHIAIQSGVNMSLRLSSLNIEGVSEGELVELLVAGGDYELLFTAPPNVREKIEQLKGELGPDIRLTRCGTAAAAKDQGSVQILVADAVLTPLELAKKHNLKGFGNDHFTKK
jgi:thiamine-monophosphate kinase